MALDRKTVKKCRRPQTEDDGGLGMAEPSGLLLPAAQPVLLREGREELVDAIAFGALLGGV